MSQTDRQTDKRTWQLLYQLGPEGRVGENNFRLHADMEFVMDAWILFVQYFFFTGVTYSRKHTLFVFWGFWAYPI